MKKVSVIIPTYKRHQFIDRVINSVLNQTYKNLEIIVVDDNGDGTKSREEMINIMKKYETDNRIKYIKSPINQGGALARNLGIEISSGDFITFLDDDDEYLPTKIEVQYNEMIKNGWDASVMDAATYSTDGKLLSRKIQRLSNNPTQQELIITHLIYHITNTNTFMFKADSIKKIGGFDDIAAGQEYMLMLKAINANLKIGYIPETLVACYIHDNERVSTGKNKYIAEKILIKEKKKHFNLLTNKQKRQVYCRHYSVLFYVQLKRKKFFSSIVYALIALFFSPSTTYKLFKEYKKKI
mgnify:FL=1